MMTKRWLLTLSMTLMCAVSASAQVPEPIAGRPIAVNGYSAFAPGLIEAEPMPNPYGRFWARGEYLFGWIQPARLPALVTSSPIGTPRAQAGVLGANGTTVLFGNEVNGSLRSGFRLEAGWLFDPERALSLDVGFMLLGSQATSFAAASDDASTILAAPFRNTNTGPSALLIAFPGVSTGSVDILAKSSSFYEGHLDITERSIDAGAYRLYSMVGYRAYRFDDSLRITQRTNPTDPNFAAGTQIVGTDSFSTKNEFHGLDLGVRSEFVRQGWTLDLTTKVAVGRMFRDVMIDGSQTVTVPGSAAVLNTGNLLALPSNIGTRSLSDWRVMPEFAAHVSWQVRSNVRLRAGYSILVLSGVSRAGDQIDANINPALLPPATIGSTPARPAFFDNHSDVWVQNLSVGFEVVY